MLEVTFQKRLPGFALDVAFTTDKELAVLFGPSGAGKSLTLQAIAGTVPPDAGRILLDGQPLYDSSKRHHLPPQQRHVGYVPQHYALFPHLSVAEILPFGWEACHSVCAPSRVAELLALCRVAECVHTRNLVLAPANFSTIDVPGSTETRALNISNRGLIVGDYTSGEGRRGFLFDGNTFTTIVDTFPGSTTTEIFAVTEAHAWVGVYIGAAKIRHAYICNSSGTFTAIDLPGSSQTEAFALNEAGMVVGAYVLNGVQHGFLLSGEPSPPATF